MSKFSDFFRKAATLEKSRAYEQIVKETREEQDVCVILSRLDEGESYAWVNEGVRIYYRNDIYFVYQIESTAKDPYKFATPSAFQAVRLIKNMGR